jgi:thiamine biosynthesis lipoprotein ApbE
VDALKISPKVKQIVIVLFLSGAVARLGAAAQTYSDAPPELLRLAKTADVMGSTYSVELYGYDRSKLMQAADAALDEARRLDDLLSNFRPESEWSRINQHAAERPMRISPEMFHLLSACVEYSREGEGAFDITVGPLMICRTMPKWRRPFSRWVTGISTWTLRRRLSGSTVREWRLTLAASVRVMPWTGWWMF